MMDNASCNLIYVDRSVRTDRLVGAPSPGSDARTEAALAASDCETPTLRENVGLLLEFIGDVRLCSTGESCMSQLFDLHDTSMVELKPTVVLIDVPNNEPISEEDSRSRSPSPHSDPSDSGSVQVYPEEDAYGIRLLQKIVSEAHLRNVSSLVVPIPLISFPAAAEAPSEGAGMEENGSAGRLLADRRILKRCLDLGAVDVMVNPLNCVTSIQIHAYRAYKEAVRERQAILEFRRGRKRSWVGVDDQKPFAYLREAMVAGLMKGICQTGEDKDDRLASIRVAVSPERRSQVTKLVSQWHFCAHDLSDDELIVAASSMFRHALAMPELARFRIATDQLNTFLIACRAAYNNFVPYHNFRHVVDVLQATFNFLVRIAALPPYPANNGKDKDGHAPPLPDKRPPMARLLRPFEALTLLITAIGHDVGHPGVNNGFLVTLNAPLAQLYNDRSVLESFHCAAYSQILRRHWPAVFEDSNMRNLMISSILATDMGLHFDYMKKLGDLQEKLQVNNSTEGWNGRMVEEQKALACALLIKCADISNVARRHDTALKWMHILSDEFSRQASMESELDIPSSLMAPPKKDISVLFKSQLGFMNMFAIPLFQGVADILPQMQYCVDELELNKALFDESIAAQQADLRDTAAPTLRRGGTLSPRTMSMVISAQDDGKDTRAADATVARPERSYSSEKPTSPTSKPPHLPELSGEYKEVNGVPTPVDCEGEFTTARDPFNMHDSRQYAPRKQRCSEATDGSASAPGGGDWASQATSATTGKMPLSPSTQGTSIISQESLERPSSVPVPVTTVTAPKQYPAYELQSQDGHDHSRLHTDYARPDKSLSEPRLDISPSISIEEDSSTSTNGKHSVEGKTLKKKTSRFRMNAFPFFRRHKGTSPPLPAADTAG